MPSTSAGAARAGSPESALRGTALGGERGRGYKGKRGATMMTYVLIFLFGAGLFAYGRYIACGRGR